MVETAGTARVPETARRLTWGFLTWWLQGSRRVRVEAVRSLDAFLQLSSIGNWAFRAGGPQSTSLEGPQKSYNVTSTAFVLPIG